LSRGDLVLEGHGGAVVAAEVQLAAAQLAHCEKSPSYPRWSYSANVR
jgi:hypothetical protein